MKEVLGTLSTLPNAADCGSDLARVSACLTWDSTALKGPCETEQMSAAWG